MMARVKQAREFSVLGPLMGGFGSQAFMGCLHLDEGSIRPCVMVFLPDDIVESPDLFARVWAETEMGAEIDHVNVIGVMGVARLDEGYARVVDYADAESLRSVYRRAQTLKKPLPPAVAIALVADACMGVHYAHELGESEVGKPWVHGGIRPETLQVSFAGMAKVTGYGAQTIAEVMRKKGGTGLISRENYTAPEQSFGGRDAATVQSDIYALGYVLYEALTAKPPFAADNDLADAMIKDELARPGLAGVTEAMTAVVLKATQRKAVDRYATALDMRMDLLERCEPAAEADIKRYLDELFPADAVPRATRIQMVKAAQKSVPAPTGRLLDAIPLELGKGHAARAKQPTDEHVEASIGRRVVLGTVHDEVTVPVRDVANDLVGRVVARSAPPPSWEAANTGRPRPAHAESTSTQEQGAVPPSDVAPRTLVATPALSTLPPTHPPGAYAFPPSQPAAPQVVSKTPAGLLIALGLFAGLALALGVVLFLKNDTPAVVVAPVPAPPTPAPPEPPAETQPELAPIPDKPVVDKADKPDKKIAKGPGTLTVRTEPEMDITVDGKAAGKGEATLELPAGKHTVTAKDKASGATVRRVAVLKPGGKETIVLTVGKGSLAVEAPPGCDVFVDGKKVGKTPFDPVELVEGNRKVVVKQGSLTYTHMVPVKAGIESFLQVQFHSQ